MQHKTYRKTKPRYDTPRTCSYCNGPFYSGRSDKVYCETSCRVAHCQLRKRNDLKTGVSLPINQDTPAQQVVYPKSLTPIQSIGASTAIILADHVFQKLGGVHNHDLKKSLLIINENQHIFNQKLDDLIFLAKQQIEIHQKRESDENSWILNMQ